MEYDYMKGCYYFTAKFKAVKSKTIGRLYSTSNEEICCDIEEFQDLHICDTDMITSEDVFLGSKKRFLDLKVGDYIVILSIPVIITDIDIESIEDFNDSCERMEMEDMIDFS